MKQLICFLLCIVFAIYPALAETASDTLAEMYARAELSLIQGNYLDAASEFDALMTYSDASKMSVYCRALYAGEVEGMYAEAINSFDMLGDFEDSTLQSSYYSARFLQAEAEENALSSDISVLNAASEKYLDAADIYKTILHFRNSGEMQKICLNGYESIRNELNLRLYGFPFGMASTSPDILNATVIAYSLPEWVIEDNKYITYSISDELILLVEKHDVFEGPCILNLTTGNKCFLYSVEEYLDSWKTLLSKSQKYSKMDPLTFEYIVETRDVMKECFSAFANSNFEMYRSGQILYWTNGSFSALIDMTSGETRPLSVFAEGLTDNANLVEYDRSNSVINILAPNGDCTHSIDLSGFIPYLPIEFQYQNARFACIARDSEISLSESMECIAATLDENGNQISVASLGHYRALQGPNRLLFSQTTDSALTYGLTSPTMLVEFDTGTVHGIVSDGNEIQLVSVNELYDESGIIKASMPLLFPLGLSYDGIYAIFGDIEHAGLMALNLNTLESNCILNPQEMASLSLTPMDLSNMHWNGSCFLANIINVFLKLTFES